MTVINLPITTYSVRSAKPNNRYGSPAVLPIGNNASRIYARVPLDKIPAGATITSAILRSFPDRTPGGSRTVRALPVTSSWNSSITWNKQPSVGPVEATLTATNPASWDLNVTTWANTRSRLGLRIDSTSAPGLYLRGSAASRNKSVLIVTYVVGPLTPGGLRPSGGSVSVASPFLTYAGDDDMTEQKVEFSIDGISPSAATAWLPATEGRFDPATAPGVQPVLTSGSTGIYWRVTTNGPTGMSSPSTWAYYEFDALPVIAFTNPQATSPDGTPALQWTVTGQQSFKADLYRDDTLMDSSGWRSEAATRDWTPSRGVKVPGGVGRFELRIRDAITPRVVANQAPVEAYGVREFTTTLDGAGTAVNTLVLSWLDPIPLITGTRAAGVPDEVALVRDDVLVPLWDADGNVYPTWAPGVVFFTGTTFSIPDYTSAPREQHTWSVRTKTNGVVSAVGPTVSGKPRTDSVWLVEPITGDRVEVLGYNDEPSVSQSTEEASILHVPLNAGLLAEPKRRRLIRTTRSGSVSGVVHDTHEDTLLRWVEGDSGAKYRLIFGKVNWPVIIGDYSPTEMFYPVDCGPDRVLVDFNWWQRLTDL